MSPLRAEPASVKLIQDGRFFLPGPTEVHASVLEAQSRPLISHRGEEMRRLWSRLQSGVGAVLGTAGPVWISTSSATSMMEAAVRSCGPERVLCLVAGAFSRRFVRIATFKNTLILLTSNVGSDLIMNLSKDPDLMPDYEGMAKALREPQLDIFPAALLGRIVSIPYFPLSDEVLQKIIVLQLNRIVRRIDENHGIPLSYSDAVLDLISARCTELESGGRMIDAILTNTVLPAISRELLSRLSQGNPLRSVKLDAEEDDFSYNFK